jgi:hypothetical protein
MVVNVRHGTIVTSDSLSTEIINSIPQKCKIQDSQSHEKWSSTEKKNLSNTGILLLLSTQMFHE